MMDLEELKRLSNRRAEEVKEVVRCLNKITYYVMLGVASEQLFLLELMRKKGLVD